MSIDPGLVPGFSRSRVTFLVDGVPVEPRVVAHRWDPDLTETVYALTDALRLHERRGIRGDVLCADWSYEGSGRVKVEGGPATGLRIPLRGGSPLGASLDERPFAAWLARHAPRLTTDSAALAERYAAQWFALYADGPGPLALKLRELRWMRALSGAEARLAVWDGAGDPYTPAIELGEHHQVSLFAAREAALDAVLARGGFSAVPTRLDQAVWHWGMVRSLGGGDLRDAVAAKFLHDGYFRDQPHITWTAALPFLLDDFGERERMGLAQAVDALTLSSDIETTWVLLALVRVGFAARFARSWSAWAPTGACAWLDTFFRGVVCDGLADVGPLRVDDVPFKEEELSLERDGPGGPARAS
ncbi:hypothetical protein [Solirubrobacter deserti]|uniref:Thiopeptide-type bacteriocin biosynthesis domain-containing protein n=1 Tax=Solirubrobacter deserti TaxID=2282478 RepID=A0ABT4RJ71_9ACTN|nr:hypothetical protein [Solirubrobacter deserti]MDA0138558.1 hypothetical protein [Solirubrobacter deserti]